MHKSRLLQIIKSLTDKEINDLSEFLISGIIKDKDINELARFFNIIKQHHPNLSHKNLEKKFVYHLMYVRTEWVSGKFDKLMVRLLKVIYQFIGIQYSHEYHNPSITVCHFLQKRNLQPVFDRVLKKWEKELDAYPYFNSNILFERFQLKEFLVTQQAKMITPKIELELPVMLQQLDQYYIFTKLKYACQLLAINIFVLPTNIKDSLKSFDYLEKLIDLPHLQLPIIKVYYQAFKMLNSIPNLVTENFNDFKNSLFLYEERLSDEQRKSMHTLIRNYAVFQYHNGQNEYLQKAFEIYHEHLKRGYLYYGNKILAQPFRNIVTFGLRLGKCDWVYDFIQAHKNKISGTKYPELVYNFNLSLYFFQVKNYDKAIENIPTHFDDTYYKVSSKRLELMIYTETDSEILDSKIDAFKIFIYRIPNTKITTKHKKANNNFIHILKQIIHPKTEFSLSRIHKLKTKIKQMETLAEKEWLMQLLSKIDS